MTLYPELERQRASYAAVRARLWRPKNAIPERVEAPMAASEPIPRVEPRVEPTAWRRPAWDPWGEARDVMGWMLCEVAGREESEESSAENGEKPITLFELRRQVCRWYGITVSQFKTESRRRVDVEPRQEFWYLAYKLTTRSIPEMVGYAGRFDHSTAIHGIKAWKKRLGVRTSDSIEAKFP